eukprot:CAMPEP_0184855158 /NCGR_PEP_ID=MMETSP0580-20130426/472_1 /TAXON_ID=1118495 /ORGANISM="Dactyliosolen fragilissimus" /LENGTH=140 /DNA_ID=CAMNT_0027349599 /DNA_START=232 /DNA_END=654 /DNA_ORIENTATION=+
MGVGNIYTALDVREEFQAHAKLDSAIEDETLGILYGCCDTFVISFDGIHGNNDKKCTSSSLGKSNIGGLRNRKDGTTNNKNDDETMLAEPNIDPLDLFGGIAPRSLKIAQNHAKQSLNAYVNAANLAAEIIRRTPSGSKS